MTGRVVVVTGASSGIGRATAHRAAGDGDHVVLVARDAAVLEQVASECRDRGAASALVQATDVSDDDAVRRLAAAVVAEHGRVDAVVNSAGVVAYGAVETVPVEVFDAVVRTNLLGSVNVARHFLPLMRQRGSGVLVLIGSVIGHIAAPSMTAYAVSKWGVRALARQLQIEVRDAPGVSVCHVSPGGVDTPIYLQAANYQGPVGRPPLPVVTPERVAAVAMRQLDRPTKRVQVGPANGLMRLGFSVLPGLFDRLVPALFPVGATDLTRRVEAGTGNVLRPVPAGERLRGRQGNALVGVARNLRVIVGRRGG